MSITFVGDVHNLWYDFLDLIEDLPEDRVIIQVGDLGIRPYKEMPPIPRKVYFIDGNHDHFPSFYRFEEVTEIEENLFYVPRGTVLNIDGLDIGFLGGAESLDRNLRTEGFDWWREESVKYREIMRFNEYDNMDLMVSHTPPTTIIRMCGLSVRPDINVSANAVEQVWNGFDKPFLVCGHVHMSRRIHDVRVLDELELFTIFTEDGNIIGDSDYVND